MTTIEHATPTHTVTDVVVRRADELTPDERAAWVRLTETVPTFDGPYFRPEFTEQVSAVRDDVEVAVLAAAGRPVGFLPFQLSGRSGMPIGGRLSDFHAVVVEPDVSWNVPDLMRACGLSSWRFDHLLAGQAEFAGHHWGTEGSPYLDLANGFEAYEADRRAAKANDVKQALRKERKLEREHDVLFEWRAHDAAFDTMIEWKNAQYRRTGKTVVFSFPWTVELLRRLIAVDEPGFGGTLSGLYANDELIAVHVGMRSRTVMHYWFPAIGEGFEKFSPGTVLMLMVAREAVARGITRIDLGKGDERYKLQFGSAAIPMAEGVVDRSSLSGFVRRSWQRTKDWVKASPLAGVARVPAGLIRPLRERFEFR